MTAPALRRQAPVWQGLDAVPVDWPTCAVTIGVFDGVHRGHARLIAHTRQVARNNGWPTVLVTFDPHPARVLGLPRDTARLSTIDHRADLAHQLGIDAVCVLPFTSELARVGAEEFVQKVLVGTLHTGAVVVGTNFTFGHRGTGTVDTLHQLGQHYGFTAHDVPLLHTVDAPCSSTYIRDCLRRGDIRAATQALGRPHRLDGYCDSTGHLHVGTETAVPAPGHYIGKLHSGQTVDVRVPADGPVLLTKADLNPGPTSIEVLERQGD